LNVCILQGSGATDLMGGVSFNSSFLYRSFLSSEKNYKNWSTFAKIMEKIKGLRVHYKYYITYSLLVCPGAAHAPIAV